jgi:hypothetical protein
MTAKSLAKQIEEAKEAMKPAPDILGRKPAAEAADAPVKAPAIKKSVISDAADLEALWLPPEAGDGLCDVHRHAVSVGKPRDFFRYHPDPAYRRHTEIYSHKPEGSIDTQHYIVAPDMRGQIIEARPCIMATLVDRMGNPRLYPVPLPREGGRDMASASSARSAVRIAIERWVRMIWNGNAYITRDAQPGYAPEPDWSKLPSYNALVLAAFGERGIISNSTHPIYRDLFGIAEIKDDDDL